MAGTVVGDLVRRNAERRRHDVAYIYPSGQQHTWLEVNERVNRLANSLRDLGCKPGAVVASLTTDGPVLNEVFFALAKIGAVRVGINYRYSPSEVSALLRHSGATLLLVEERFADLAGPGAPAVVRCGDGQAGLGEYGDLIAAGAADEPDVTVDEDDLASICYTTGSTGNPKGARWTHRNVVEALSHTSLDAGMRPEDVWLHCLPGAGVPGLLAVWNAVLGWTNVILAHFSPAACLDAIIAHRVTSTVWVPTMLHAVVEEQAVAPRPVASVRKIVYGSAPTTPALIRRALDTFPHARLEQWYGATEGAGGWFTRLGHEDHTAALAGEEKLLTSCGKPMHHVDVHIRGEDGTRLPAGEVGEVCVRGAFVMAGYHDEPELTAQRLRDGWLCTGDMGRLDDRGYVYLVERKEFLVITGGYNVYPVEVENAIAEHPGVAEVAVFGVPDERWGEIVRAVVALKPGRDVAAEELRDFCRGRLATFKVPKEVVFTEELPRGPTGKLLKRQMKEEAVAGGRR